MLRLFEGMVLRHDQPPHQPPHQAAFVPVVEKVRIRQPYRAVPRILPVQQFYHGAPFLRHALPGRAVGGHAAAVLVPGGHPVVPPDGDALHGKEPHSEILRQTHMAGHRLQRLHQQIPLIHHTAAADAVVKEQQIALYRAAVILRRVVGGAVKGRFPGAGAGAGPGV